MLEYLFHRKDEIVLATIDLISECGINGLSTRNVARRAGISEGTIFKHFSTKNELLLAVLEKFSAFDKEIEETIKMRKMAPKDGISFFVRAYAEYYENYPAITAVSQALEELSYDPLLVEQVKKILFARWLFLKSLVEEAQGQGQLNPEVTGESIVDIIMGLLRHECFKWRLLEHSYSLKENTIYSVQKILESFSKN